MNATDERTALERAVRAEPEDDTVRLVFADFLQEMEPERAELVRTQIWLHRSWASGRRTSTENRRRSTRVRRMLELVTAAPTWCPCLPVQSNNVGYFDQLKRGDLTITVAAKLSAYLHTVTFCRGFIDSVSLSTDVFMGAAGPLFRTHPVSSVYINDREPAHLNRDVNRTFCWIRYPEGFDISRCITRSFLPDEIFRLLSGGRPSSRTSSRREYVPVDGFVEEDAGSVRMHAANDLYGACLLYGRSLAPLTDLSKGGTAP